MLQKSKEGLKKRHNEQKTVVERNVGELVKCVATRFLGMVVCMNRAILKCCLQGISELDYLSKICVGIALHFSSKVLGVILTLQVGVCGFVGSVVDGGFRYLQTVIHPPAYNASSAG